MSSTGAGYDYSCGQFSPDGRIFQVEYAQKAVENSGTAIGIKCRDGVVVAVEKVSLFFLFILSILLYFFERSC
jgi:20S proteasome subunit alpha 7